MAKLRARKCRAKKKAAKEEEAKKRPSVSPVPVPDASPAVPDVQSQVDVLDPSHVIELPVLSLPQSIPKDMRTAPESTCPPLPALSSGQVSDPSQATCSSHPSQ